MRSRHLRQWFIGSPLPTGDLGAMRLDRVRALAVLSPDALASVAYANQEIFLGLAAAGAAGLAYSWTIAVVIVALLAIVTLSYMQTIQAYPAGGGSYMVARTNLGTVAGLVAASALLIDYVLNAAVSLTAGVGALASAFPELWPYRTILSLILLVGITLINLRGLQEAGTAMIFPVYLFLGTYIGMIIYGIFIGINEGPITPVLVNQPVLLPVTLGLLLRTFASGATALTGVEAISNAVPVFEKPDVRHARQTMIVMALLMGVLFLGTVGLTQYLGVTADQNETILSALARRLFGSGAIHLLVQLATLLVLIVAANTSFAGFPRVTSIMAGDGFLPRQLQLLGDRLVYSNGILLLAGLAGMLIVIFQGDTHSLIPLFAVGAFLAFTLSQLGMVVHWLHERGVRWQAKAFLNGLGAIATGLALLVITVSKFVHGAWIVVVLIPLFVWAFIKIRAHYDEVALSLSLAGIQPHFNSYKHPRVVIPVAGVHRGVVEALQFAQTISDRIEAVHVEIEPDSGIELAARWHRYGLDEIAPLVVLPSPYRTYIRPLLDYIDRRDADVNDGMLASVIIPEFVPQKWWQNLLHNQTAWLLKVAFTYRRYHHGMSRAIIDIPIHLESIPFGRGTDAGDYGQFTAGEDNGQAVPNQGDNLPKS